MLLCFQLKYGFLWGPHSMLPGGGTPCPLCQSRDGDLHFSHNPGVSSPEPFLSGRSSVKETLGDHDEVHLQTLRGHRPGARSARAGTVLRPRCHKVMLLELLLIYSYKLGKGAGWHFSGPFEDPAPESSQLQAFHSVSAWPVVHAPRLVLPPSSGEVAGPVSIWCGL